MQQKNTHRNTNRILNTRGYTNYASTHWDCSPHLPAAPDLSDRVSEELTNSTTKVTAYKLRSRVPVGYVGVGNNNNSNNNNVGGSSLKGTSSIMAK